MIEKKNFILAMAKKINIWDKNIKMPRRKLTKIIHYLVSTTSDKYGMLAQTLFHNKSRTCNLYKSATLSSIKQSGTQYVHQ